LIYWARFGDLAAVLQPYSRQHRRRIAAAVVGTGRHHQGGPAVRSGTLAVARRAIAPVLLIFTFLVPVIFYDQRYILDLGILVLTYVMLDGD